MQQAILESTISHKTESPYKQVPLINHEIIQEVQNLMRHHFVVKIKHFLEDTEMYLQDMEAGIEQSDADITLLPASTIKLSAQQLGLERIAVIAKNIEAKCQHIASLGQGCFIELRALCMELKEEFSEATLVVSKL